MDFSHSKTKNIYGDRSAHESWKHWCELNLRPEGKDVADIGCGGGIYSKAFSDLGAKSVCGIDNSEQYIDDANFVPVHKSISFLVGSASNTGLERDSIDLVFERALIHHLSVEQKKENLKELKRILRKSGILAIQDRTYEDVISLNSEHWIRSTLFCKFPKLLEFERNRRPAKSFYSNLIIEQEFTELTTSSFSEVRRTYSNFEELENEILLRKGKSILFELSDNELKEYCFSLRDVARGQELKEVDQWTIWLAKAP
jgi:ubiquinone/menaquinone biosynthesis C-methylase UbiE